VSWRSGSGQSAARLKLETLELKREFSIQFHVSLLVLTFDVQRSLLIGLSIFRALVTECRRDVSLLSPSLLASVNVTLTALSSDLEVAARTASVVSSYMY
jgi:hypothetical protein